MGEADAAPGFADGSAPVASRQQHASATQWSQFQADAANSGYTEMPGPAEGSVAWTYDTGSPGQATATSPESGTPFDEVPDDSRDSVVSSPAVADGTVYVGSNDGSLYAIDAVSGEEAWAYDTGEEVMSSPAVVDGTVYVARFDATLWAMDAANGDILWSFATQDQIFSSPAVTREAVYVGSADHSLSAIDRDTGDELFSVETDRPVLSSPAVTAGTVFVGSSDSQVSAVGDPTGGESVSATPRRRPTTPRPPAPLRSADRAGPQPTTAPASARSARSVPSDSVPGSDSVPDRPATTAATSDTSGRRALRRTGPVACRWKTT